MEIVSLSLGSSRRDFRLTLTVCGQRVRLTRLGVDGQVARLASLLREYDGRAAAIGLGGINFDYRLGPRRYHIPLGQRLRSLTKDTPLVDGSGYKEAIEAQVPRWLEEKGILLAGRQVLVVSVLDRYHLTRALVEIGARVWVGDAVFGLKIPLLFSLPTFQVIAAATLPLLRLLPVSWLYPLGRKQEEVVPRFSHLFRRAEIIAGDFHFLRRYLPWDLAGKTIIASTINDEDVGLLRKRGASVLVTLSPFLTVSSPQRSVITTSGFVSGRAFGANAMEALLVALAGERGPLSKEHYRQLWRQTGLESTVIRFD
ncbi:MAG: quinate 5-dehydrogenase [Firmicutes bacterium]|nr:quinate 5-dehydrogenase [Bacillota bacterium]MCL5038818.1 quinate 5-dehydrogenase [Bacillota bacterium]